MNVTHVPVAVVSSRTEADLIVGLLESHGVKAFVLADDAGGQEPSGSSLASASSWRNRRPVSPGGSSTSPPTGGSGHEDRGRQPVCDEARAVRER
jgi:hypothetical protein